jgi:hypothetical protein
MPLSPDLIARVDEQTGVALSPFVGADWSVGAGELEWSCWETGAHLADAYWHHAARILAQPTEAFLPAEVRMEDWADVEGLLRVIGVNAELLRRAAVDADPASRAWHDWGTSDPAGTIAMGGAEGLVHTWDMAHGLGSDWRPPAELCVPVLERLFPGAPGGDPASVLLWSTGREALPGRERLTKWRWYSSPRD